ncbi:hypothetical protein GR160_10650 [Flavobacterium sp. Sd200]|uniref:caspase family protein n=1 Tax=Flavobacterium sp. Sd200 TaxID=2692211 RepID=UPI0013709905|nr:caspase family protein [Flavobacterium sp. Sd200]MXN91685.1 hypothetical protein [Flavobacterium sp. Sd200]
MSRCAVIIGVNKTGGLPALEDAVSNARDFEAWAISQGFETTLLTDDTGKVTIDMAYNAVTQYVESLSAELLIIYFSGHGIIKGPTDEFWLLSDAPQRSDAAINLQTSRLYSRCSGIPHVVFISDACRSKPTNFEQLSLRGSVLFSPIEGQQTIPKVDMFYATAPGDTALEVEITEDNIKSRRSLYTKLLLEGLHGKVPAIIRSNGRNDIIMSYELSEYLVDTLPKALRDANVLRNQVPDSEITSREPMHLSRFPKKRSPVKKPLKGTRTQYMKLETLEQRIDSLDRKVQRETISFSKESIAEQQEYIDLFQEAARPLFSDVETGFVIIGAQPVFDHLNHWRGITVSEQQENTLIEIQQKLWYGRTFPLQTKDGTVYPLAVMPNYIGRVIFKDGILASVNYTPSQTSDRFLRYTELHYEIERRRALIALNSKNGAFRINHETRYLMETASYYRMLKEFDPTLGVYAAYAYMQAGAFNDVKSVFDFMAREPEPVLFDVALLNDIGRFDLSLESVELAAPFCPVLTQGWSFLALSDKGYTPAIQELTRYLIPGLWTSFKPGALEIINKYNMI